VGVSLALAFAYFRGTYVDTFGTFLCVLVMSISAVVYVIGLQFLLGKLLRYGPVWGFDTGTGLWKFLVVPVAIGVISGVGAEIRLFRTFFLDETNQDYVRTARAKGVSEAAVLSRHVFKNALIPIITSTVAAIPGLILGSLLIENFFGIPGLGNFTVDAINSQDFAVVRAMVFLGTLLYIVGLVLTDICYALVDPRVRLE
jgi:peptide/nickel transport system permease protein